SVVLHTLICHRHQDATSALSWGASGNRGLASAAFSLHSAARVLRRQDIDRREKRQPWPFLAPVPCPGAPRVAPVTPASARGVAKPARETAAMALFSPAPCPES